MKTNTKNLTLMAVLVALMFLFGFTPIGYIPTPWGVQITLMCLPVIIGTLVLGLRTGFFLGIVFAITSLIQMLMGTSVLFNLLVPNLKFGPDLIKLLLIIFVPRLLIGPLTYAAFSGIKGKNPKVRLGFVSALGSIINTVVFLGMLYAFFGGQLGELLFGGVIASNIAALNTSALAFVISIVVTNGLPEAIVAGLVCVPVVLALRKSLKLEKIG